LGQKRAGCFGELLFSYVVEHSEGNEQHLLADDVTWARLQKKGKSSFRNAEEIHL